MFDQNQSSAVGSSQPPQAPAPTVSGGNNPLRPVAGENVYVMPDKFHPKRAGSLGKKIVIAAVVFAAVASVSGAYVAYDYFSRQAAVQAPAENIALTPEAETTTEPELTAPEEIITPTSTPETTIPPVATTTPTPPPTPDPNAPAVLSRDSDTDGLTDIEEELMGTNSDLADTDGDGFKDGSEVLNGYSPVKPGAAKLAADSFIAVLKTNFSADNFQTMYPKDWAVSYLPETKQAIITIPTGEIIKISVKSNDSGLSAVNWYLDSHPEVLTSELEKITAGSLSGLISANGLAAYLTAPDKKNLYLFEYLLNPQTEMKYPTIFSVLVKNFSLASSTPAVLE